ncbi:TetR/AcrR family transcriptional regulator [Corynebacterium sp. CCM 9204]|uniref:TetR/AcrR family transcriptional regulator n=1 Tax=Corynebacterium sp. CCM 9204 TaxID=3057616 RepID=UPI003526299D
MKDIREEKKKAEGGRRGRPLTVSRERVIEIAADHIMTKGAAGFSMRGVAEEIGVTAMALYHHFDSKNSLIAEAFLHTLKAGSPAELPSDPVDRIVAICMEIIDHLEKFPFAKEVIVSGEDTAIVFGSLYRDFAMTAHRSGVPGPNIVRSVQALRRIIVGEVIARQVDRNATETGQSPYRSESLFETLPWDIDRAAELLEESARTYSVDELLRTVAVEMLGERVHT